MAIMVRCACGTQLSIPDQLAGKTARCPKCQQPLQIPGGQARRPETGPTPQPASGGFGPQPGAPYAPQQPSGYGPQQPPPMYGQPQYGPPPGAPMGSPYGAPPMGSPYGGAPMGGGGMGGGTGVNSYDMQMAYDPMFRMYELSPEQRQYMGSHQLSSFPTPVAILLHFLTLGLFPFFFYRAMHGNLPRIRQDDMSAGKAIGMSFIPIFNIYWMFVVWLSLTDRINFQFRLRDRPEAISRGLVLATLIMRVIPYIGLIAIVIMDPIVIGQTQAACNTLARDRQMGG